MLELFFLILFIVYVCVPNPSYIGVTEVELWKCVCYPLMHASFLHLVINCLALGLMFRPIWNLYIKRFWYMSCTKFICLCYVAAVLAAIPTATSVPTVGSSGMCYFLLGMLLALRPTLSQLRSMFWVFACIVFQLFYGHSNVMLHIVAFAYGMLFVGIMLLYVRIRNSKH